MSRCFPYPPPGYVRNGMRCEALIESIKLQRENEKAITERRKEKKREKKEKKKERKEKEKEKEKTHEIFDGELKRVDNLLGTYLPKEREDETEQLEKSGLTEEHEQSISQNPCYLSDSTQSNKRKWRTTSLSNGSQNQGNTLRIRFSFKKHREADALASTEHLCSTSREDYRSQHDHDAVPQFQDTNTRTNTVVTQITSGAGEGLHSHSLRKDSSGQCSYDTAVLSHKHKTHDAESAYKALVEDWLPPPLWVEQNNVGDEDWLFGTKHQERGGIKRKTESEISCYESLTLRPRAHFLPSCEIYALPYTIPF